MTAPADVVRAPVGPRPEAAPATSSRRRARWSLFVGSVLAALITLGAVACLIQVWTLPMHVPFQYAHAPSDDEQDATLDLMIIKDVHDTGWYTHNPQLDAPFEQHWAEWPMGGDLLAYVIKKGMVDATGDVALTFNLFWLLTFPLTALVAFPVLRALRCSWSTSLAAAVLFALSPYHFRNGAGHENLAFYLGIPIIVLLCVRVLGPDGALPSPRELRHRAAWWRLRWLLLGTVLVAVTGLYYLAFLFTLVAFCALVATLIRRRPDRLVLAALFGAVGLLTSFLANLPTLLYRAQHAKNILGVPDRELGVAESYPLRIVELLSPVTGHRFGPFAALADRLYEPGREGLGTAELGLAAAIGFVCVVVALLIRALRSPRATRGWSNESRLGIVVVGALVLATKGGLSRPLELVGLSGVRAWSRIAIVVAFACIVVFARLLDRGRVALRRRVGPRYRRWWPAVIAVVIVLGALDQASPSLVPGAAASTRARLWHADGAFVHALEHELPRDAMVFQLPVVDFPQHAFAGLMNAYDLIKEGYLHSTTLRWSTGGVRGRDGEWQFPAARLPLRDLVRGIEAMGFRAVMIDRHGLPSNGTDTERQLDALLGPPIVDQGHLVAWDLRGAPGRELLAGLDARGTHALAQRLLDAPRLYLWTDAVPVTDRGDVHAICGRGTITLVNPAHHRVHVVVEVVLRHGASRARTGHVTVDDRAVAIATRGTNRVAVDLRPGETQLAVRIDRFGLRCGATPDNALPKVSAQLAG